MANKKKRDVAQYKADQPINPEVMPAIKEVQGGLPALLDDRLLSTLENEVAIDEALTETIDHLGDGTNDERMAKVKAILRGHKAIFGQGGVGEALSVLVGAVVQTVRDYGLWRLEMMDGTAVAEGKVTNYDERTGVIEFVQHYYPTLSTQRIKQCDLSFQKRQVFVPDLRKAGVDKIFVMIDDKRYDAMPTVETDIRDMHRVFITVRDAATLRANLSTKDKPRLWPMGTEADGSVKHVQFQGTSIEDMHRAERLGKVWAVQTYLLAIKLHKAGAKNRDNAKTFKPKPPYAALNEARMQIIEFLAKNVGVSMASGRPTKDGGNKPAEAKVDASKPAPEPLPAPQDVTPAINDAVNRAREFIAIYDEFVKIQETYPDGPERDMFFDHLTDGQGERLTNKGASLRDAVVGFIKSWDFWEGVDQNGKPKKPKKMGDVPIQRIAPDPALEGFKLAPKKGKSAEGAGAKA